MGLFRPQCSIQWTKMAVFNAGAKIIKPADEKADETELAISQALLELEIKTDLKNQLRELFISGAREVDLGGAKKALIILVPVPMLRGFQKIQSRLVRELEKKFSGKHVDLVFPSEIVGKRILVKLDGTKIIKVQLEKSQQTQVDYKTDTFSAVYKKLTGKEVNFEFPEWCL